jgi:hypothetical protein
LPLPLAPDVTVIHESLLVAVHAQPLPAVTATLPVPPPDGVLALVGAIENEHPLPWLTVKAWPAMVAVPERDPPVVAATLSFTTPLPAPVAPDVIVIHGTELPVVQLQPDVPVTFTVISPPDAPIC